MDAWIFDLDGRRLVIDARSLGLSTLRRRFADTRLLGMERRWLWRYPGYWGMSVGYYGGMFYGGGYWGRGFYGGGWDRGHYYNNRGERGAGGFNGRQFHSAGYAAGHGAIHEVSRAPITTGPSVVAECSVVIAA